MKASTLLVVLLIAVLFFRCKSNAAATDFSGTYVLETKGEYAIDFDTLILDKVKLESNTYLIKKVTGYQQIKNGSLLPKKISKDSWTATWDEQKQVLSENNLGRQMRFEKGSNTLIIKNSEYKKIK